MAAKAPKVVKPSVETTELVLNLNAPGMNSMLRAGLGGLAAVLLSMESEESTNKLPGGPFQELPWEVTKDKIVLRFGQAEAAGEYLKRLFEYAFRIEKGEDAIDLPATYDGKQTTFVRARLQQGLITTFLQHGKSRSGAAADEVRFAEIDGKQIDYSIRPLTGYKHQTLYKDLVNEDGMLIAKTFDLPGTLYPGAAVRHNKFAGQTKHEATTAELLAACFAMIGTLALPINRGAAVLLVPEVNDLRTFGDRRFAITPGNEKECFIGGIGDAVLGLQARVRGQSIQRKLDCLAVEAYLFQPTAWASQQKSRVASTRVEPLDPHSSKIYDYVCSFLPPQSRTQLVEAGSSKTKTKVERTFWVTSIVRTLITDNLAAGRVWFHDFVSLYTRNDPVSGKPLRMRLFSEKKGLASMVQSDVWNEAGQKTLVTSVQFALKSQFGKIAKEMEGNVPGMRNRFDREFEKWRIEFSTAKTADQFRFSVCDLMSRARGNSEIQQNWQSILPLLSDKDWKHGRDLALLALASYGGKGDKEDESLVQNSSSLDNDS